MCFLFYAFSLSLLSIISLCYFSFIVFQTSDKSTAFHMACAQGSLEIVKLLVSYDLSIGRTTLLDAEGQTPLHRAATNNHVSVVEYLLDQVGKIRWFYYLFCCCCCFFSAVGFLIFYFSFSAELEYWLFANVTYQLLVHSRLSLSFPFATLLFPVFLFIKQ